MNAKIKKIISKVIARRPQEVADEAILNRKKAQMFLEYALILATVAGAAALMFPYAQRAVYARLKHTEQQINLPDTPYNRRYTYVVEDFIFKIFSYDYCFNPDKNCFVINFCTNSYASASVKIYSYGIRGKQLVRDLGSVYCEPEATVEWDHKNDKGQVLPHGVYICEIFAQDSDGTGNDTEGFRLNYLNQC